MHMLLLLQAEWSAGSELQWGLVGFLEESFSALVLLVRPGGLTQAGQQQQQGLREPLSAEPRRVLLEGGLGVSLAALESLQQQLLEAQVRHVMSCLR